MSLRVSAVLLGGGIGKRYSTGAIPKQFEWLGSAPVFIHALKAFLSLDHLHEVVLTFPANFLPLAQQLIDDHIPTPRPAPIRLVVGGERRQDSAFEALKVLSASGAPPDRVLIHDACRPFLSRDLLSRIQEKIADRAFPAWIPVVPVVETLKRVENQRVVETIDRSAFYRVQTPQIFDFSLIHELARKVKAQPELTFTDDASICEYYGVPVGAFEGDVRNLKLTYEFERQTLDSLIRAMDRETDRKKERSPSCEPASVTTSTV